VKVRARGLCNKHYKELQKQGPLPPLDRFWPKVIKTNACWIWTGGKNQDGYGTYGGRMAHRVAYERTVGAVPKDLHIDHVCRNHACVRPDHLRPRDPHENMSDNGLRDRAACTNGHEYTPATTAYRERYGRVSRVCRTCERERQKAYKAKKRRP
jgi:hypothetical protein